MTKVWCGLSPPSARQNHVVNHGYITSGSSRLFSASRCVARLGFNSITNTPEREIEDLVSIIYHYLVGSVVPFPTENSDDSSTKRPGCTHHKSEKQIFKTASFPPKLRPPGTLNPVKRQRYLTLVIFSCGYTISASFRGGIKTENLSDFAS